MSQQAALLCQDARFRGWLADTYHDIAKDGPDAAAEVVRRILGVASRSELDRDPAVAERWTDLHETYQRNVTTAQYADSQR
jgi:hypothetical protein